MRIYAAVPWHDPPLVEEGRGTQDGARGAGAGDGARGTGERWGMRERQAKSSEGNPNTLALLGQQPWPAWGNPSPFGVSAVASQVLSGQP